MDSAFIFLWPMLGIAFWGGVFYLGVRLVRAVERRGADKQELAELRARVARLEEELGTASAELERLAEGQRFTTALLSGRPPEPPPAG